MLPKVVFADSDAEYRGDTFFPNSVSRKGFPIYLVINKYYTPNRRGVDRYAENARTMLSLKLY